MSKKGERKLNQIKLNEKQFGVCQTTDSKVCNNHYFNCLTCKSFITTKEALEGAIKKSMDNVEHEEFYALMDACKESYEIGLLLQYYGGFRQEKVLALSNKNNLGSELK